MRDDINNLPKLTLTLRQQCDFELIANGGFAPLSTFLGKKDYISVVKHMRLTDGQLWPIPVVLDIPDYQKLEVGEEVLLVDEYNMPLATMKVNEIYKLNKDSEAEHVYGSKSEEHFGVNYLLRHTHDRCISGPLTNISLPEHHNFVEWRQSPKELKKKLRGMKNKYVVAFQTRNPIHAAHLAMIEKASKDVGAHILIHPVVGQTKDGDISYITRVKSYTALFEKRLKGKATLSLLPLAMRMAGPREALWHALIRRNYGATHFIVGRDHAGPGKDKLGKQFYHPLAAQKLAKEYEKELKIQILPFDEMVYVKSRKKYIPQDEVIPGEKILSISGTQFRQLLMHNKSIPSWFAFPEVVKVLRAGLKREIRSGLVILFTGLPSSGKSTLARLLQHKILEYTHRSVSLLDGDVVRQHISKGLGFNKEDRNENIKRIGFVASEIAKHGGVAICAAIAPYRESRLINRRLIGQYGKYIEVYVSTPLRECVRRDIKGLYNSHRGKIVSQLTGKDDPYEVPLDPEIVIDTTNKPSKVCIDFIWSRLKELKVI